MTELRARTAHAHADVDHAFGGYDLTSRDDYRALLLAHAYALPAAEALIGSNPALPPTRPRTALLASDLAGLEQSMPAPLNLVESGAAGGWGVLYVVEGSRLGGGLLARRVGTGMPRRYLADSHAPGEWRGFGAAIDTEALRHGAAWLAEAVRAAEVCFDLYRRAAACVARAAA